MEIFYTKIYNYIGDNANKQEIIGKVAENMGIREMSLFRYPDACDTDRELFYRMEGVYSSFSNESTVIFQYPSMVSARYDREVTKHLRLYYNSKLILFFENLGQEVDPANYPSLEEEMEILNSADLLILPAANIRKALLAKGLKRTIPCVYLEFWDFPNGIHFNEFGSTDLPYIYLEDGQAYKAGYYIANQVPVIVSENSEISEFVKNYRIGTISDTKEVSEKDKEMLASEETKFNLKAVNDLGQAGFFTQKAISQAICKALLKTIK